MSAPIQTPAQALVAWSRSASFDPQAKQMALEAIDRMMQGSTWAGALLTQAFDANVAYAQDMSSEKKAQRATLARKAYNARVNTELARFIAAYAMLAEAAGNEAASIRSTANRVADQANRRVLIERAKGAEMRRNVLIQAAQATQKAMSRLPPLPDAAARRSDQIEQRSINVRGDWRPPAYIERANVFFPEDVRIAAGAAGFKGLGAVNSLGQPVSLGGLSEDVGGDAWWTPFFMRVQEGVAAVAAGAKEEAQKVADAMPSTADAIQRGADANLELLKRAADENWPVSSQSSAMTATASTMTSMLTNVPSWVWWTLAAGGAYLVLKKDS